MNHRPPILKTTDHGREQHRPPTRTITDHRPEQQLTTDWIRTTDHIANVRDFPVITIL